MPQSPPELLGELRKMNEYEFEELVADVWEEYGWDTEVTSGSKDRGIDVIADKSRPFEQKAVIQAKRYGEQNKVGSSEIQQYSSLRHQREGADTVVVVTTSSFSSAAEEMASDLNVKLVNGHTLCDIILECDNDLLEEYSIGGLSKCPVCTEEIFDEEVSLERIAKHCTESSKCKKSIFEHEYLNGSKWASYVSSQEDWEKLHSNLHKMLVNKGSFPLCDNKPHDSVINVKSIINHCEQCRLCRGAVVNYEDLKRSPWSGYIIKKSDWQKIQRKFGESWY